VEENGVRKGGTLSLAHVLGLLPVALAMMAGAVSAAALEFVLGMIPIVSAVRIFRGH
jgi:hypothetical protein